MESLRDGSNIDRQAATQQSSRLQRCEIHTRCLIQALMRRARQVIVRVGSQGRRGCVLVSQMEFLTFGAAFFSAGFSRLACFSAESCCSGCGVLVWGQSTARQNEVRAPASNLRPINRFIVQALLNPPSKPSRASSTRRYRSPTTLVNTSFDQFAAGPPPERGEKRDG